MRATLVAEFPRCDYGDRTKYHDSQIASIYHSKFPKNKVVMPAEHRKSRMEYTCIGFEMRNGYVTAIMDYREVQG